MAVLESITSINFWLMSSFTKTTFSFLLLLLSIFSACNREDNDQSSTETPIYPAVLEFHDSHISGLVKSEDNILINDASITVNEKLGFTNHTGLFIFKDVKSNKAGEIIQISKQGYFDEYIYYISDKRDVTNHIITLKKLTSFISINSSEENAINIDNNISIKIPALSFVNEWEETYNGQVKLYYRKIQELNAVPVEMLNYDQKIFLNSFIYQLEIVDDRNEKLKLKNAIEISTIKEISTVAAFNYNRDVWKEIKNTKNGNEVSSVLSEIDLIAIGNVNDVAFIETTLTNNENNPISNLKMNLKNGENNFSVQSSQSGKLKFYVPANSDNNLEYVDINGIGRVISNFNLPKGKHLVSPMILEDDNIFEIKSELKNCDSGEINEDEMIALTLAQGNDIKEVFYQTSKEETYYALWDYNNVKASYFAHGKPIYSISKSQDEPSKFLLSNDNYCIPDLIGYLKIKDDTKYYSEPQISIINESANAISITDNIGFIISFDNPKEGIEISPSIMLISDPQNITCMDNNCTQLKAVFEKLGEKGSEVAVKFSGIYNGNKIEGSFESILK